MVADVRSLLIYFLSFLISVFTAYIYQEKVSCTNKIKKIGWYTAIILFPVLVAGFRYGVGTDYFRYVLHFENTSKMSWIDVFQTSAPLYYAFIKLCLFIVKPRWMFLVFSYTTLVILLIALEYWREKISLSFTLLIYYVSFYAWSLNGLRQGIAITMILLACTYLVFGQYKLYFLWLFLAVMVHSTAIIALLFFFCVKLLQRNNYKYVLFEYKIPVCDIHYLMVLFLSPFIMNTIYLIIEKFVVRINYFSKYQKYLGQYNAGIGILLIFILLFWPIMLNMNEMLSDTVFRQTTEIATTFLLFGYMGYMGYTMYRLRLYSYLIAVVMISQFCRKKKGIIKKFYYTYYFTLFFVYDYVGQTMKASDIFPYRNILVK